MNKIFNKLFLGLARTFIGLNGAQDRILVHYSQRGNGRSGRNAEYGIYG